MNAKEYLRQAYRLDQRINSNIEEVSRLREMASSVSAPVMGDRVQTNKSAEAPFVRCLDKIMTLEEKINKEIDLLVSLKEQMRDVINLVEDTDERMVLRYRYIHNLTWEQIGLELNADARTIRRWHGSALTHVKLPKDAIKI